ncbi:hypothetical protein Bca52824_021028 [Brassica carinata]|uniref:Uncharacterized protein n=1 Tax=Brassica carinata TaxID=52824 RepID=A0A8X7VUX1_BRACI|nr:hypothetical protein Bca52824_021028 [Brassica carinata]
MATIPLQLFRANQIYFFCVLDYGWGGGDGGGAAAYNPHTVEEMIVVFQFKDFDESNIELAKETAFEFSGVTNVLKVEGGEGQLEVWGEFNPFDLKKELKKIDKSARIIKIGADGVTEPEVKIQQRDEGKPASEIQQAFKRPSDDIASSSDQRQRGVPAYEPEVKIQQQDEGKGVANVQQARKGRSDIASTSTDVSGGAGYGYLGQAMGVGFGAANLAKDVGFGAAELAKDVGVGAAVKAIDVANQAKDKCVDAAVKAIGYGLDYNRQKNYEKEAKAKQEQGRGKTKDVGGEDEEVRGGDRFELESHLIF